MDRTLRSGDSGTGHGSGRLPPSPTASEQPGQGTHCHAPHARQAPPDSLQPRAGAPHHKRQRVDPGHEGAAVGRVPARGFPSAAGAQPLHGRQMQHPAIGQVHQALTGTAFDLVDKWLSLVMQPGASDQVCTSPLSLQGRAAQAGHCSRQDLVGW